MFAARLNNGRAGLIAFIVEGSGLWLEKRWTEYHTFVATASLLPFEIYEAVEKVTALRAIVLLLNVAIVIYLVWRVRHEGATGREARARSRRRSISTCRIAPESCR